MVSEASPPFSRCACRRDFSRRRDERRNGAPSREKCSMRLYNNVVTPPPHTHTPLLHEAANPPRPLSSTLLPHYEQSPLCQALPQAAPRNYSPMPPTGETDVCYTPHAELRKTTMVGPLFVNQTQGQKNQKKNMVCHILSPSWWKIVRPKSFVLILLFISWLLYQFLICDEL